MLPAQLAIVAESALGPLPTTKEFVERLSSGGNPQGPPADQALFGSVFSSEAQPPLGTVRNQAKALRSFLEFCKVCEVKGCVLDNLDECFTGFAKWSVDVAFLFDDDPSKEEALKQRVEMCQAAGVAVRSWSLQTLKTIVNALALQYRQTSPSTGIVMSSTKQFPKFCLIFNAALKRSREKQCQEQPVDVVTDDEMAQLFDKTNWKSPYEAQRMNLLLFAFSLGQRPDTLIGLRVGQCHPLKDPAGELMLEVAIGTMKNQPARQQTAAAPLHKQQIFTHTNAKLCALGAYERQLQLLGSVRNAEGYLFRSLKTFSKNVPANPMSYATCRGAALWVRAELGRDVTFKDCARRPVFTKLANAMSAYDAAKAVGVRAQTIQHYHRAVEGNVLRQAAEVLRQVACRCCYNAHLGTFLGGRKAAKPAQACQGSGPVSAAPGG